MSKLASGDKKRNLNIQKIKALRREALCQSYNSKIPEAEQLSSRVMVNDLNALISPKKSTNMSHGLGVSQ